jgi:hypothetical protein
MSKKGNSRSGATRSHGSDRSQEGAKKLFQKGYVPQDKRGYTPVATTSKLPKAPQGGTGQSGPAPSTSQTDGNHS